MHDWERNMKNASEGRIAATQERTRRTTPMMFALEPRIISTAPPHSLR